MGRNFVFILSLLVLSSCFLHMRFNPVEVKAVNGHPVHNLNTGINYTTIQEAIDSPETLAGHRILVDAGTYYEHVIIHKSVSLIGENRNTTIIDGSHSGTVIIIQASYVNVTGFSIQESGTIMHTESGIYITEGTTKNNVSNNIITGSNFGIMVEESSENTISGNDIVTNSAIGIYFKGSARNNASENNVKNNLFGVAIESSTNTTLSGNEMNNNNRNLVIVGLNLSHYLHSIDVSNLVNGKPVYYFVNEKNLVITPATHQEIGYLAFINSSNIKVEGLTVTNNGQGVLLAYTNNSRLTNNTFTDNNFGIYLDSSYNNTVSLNGMTRNLYSVLHAFSSNNTISSNNITSSYCGVLLETSFNNTLDMNDIYCTEIGIYLKSSSDNEFYHNNFVDNIEHVSISTSGYSNIWDNGIEGNCWSDYTGLDSNHDGIGDSWHETSSDNIDLYPLMGMFSSFNTSVGYHVNVISNSTINDFEYFESNHTIKMHVSNMTANQTFGFVRICIPHALMNDTYHVIINDGEPYYVNYTLYDNETHRWIYFSYQHSTLEIIIISELTTSLTPLILLITTLLTVIAYKKKHSPYSRV